MARRHQSGYFDLNKFAASLHELMEGLPTDTERAVLRQQFEDVIAFLNQTQKALTALPTKEETEDVRKAIQAFDELAARAKASPFLAAAIGQPPLRLARQKSAPLTLEENAKAQSLLKELKSLSIDEMSVRLREEERFSSRELNAIAALVGIRTTRRTTRDILVQQIVTKISNFRGYQELQGRSAE